jgi:hypothetical protein
MNDLHEVSSTLVAHCGAHKVTRDELMEIPVPEGTRTHQPLSHYEIVEVLEEALSFRYLKIVRDEYAVSQDGMKMFGVMDLNSEFSGGRFSIGLRNSNDKSMRLALTAGIRVFVCDNMAFSGDFTPLLHKHTRNLELRDSISIAVDRIHRGFEPLKQKVQAMREQFLSEEEVKLIIYRAFLDRSIKGIPRHLMPLVHDYYFHPEHEAFIPRNLWSLSNAFTSAFKKLAPIKQFEVTARLGSYLDEVQNSIRQRQELFLPIQKDEKVEEDRQAEQLGQLQQTGQNAELINSNRQSENPQDTKPGFKNGIGYIACGKDEIREGRDFGDEDFDEEDIPDDPFETEIFDDYFDEDQAIEEIDEAEEKLIEEFEQRLAA